MARNWSKAEVEAVVSDYFEMLSAELAGITYNKSEHRRRLKNILTSRSERSIEDKHQNISAILISQGYPYISGYKPLRNFQRLLSDVVIDRIDGDQTLAKSVEVSVALLATVPNIADILSSLEQAPERADNYYPFARSRPPSRSPARKVDYLAREASNSSLGLAGEEFVVNFERERLLRSGAGSYADQVEHTSKVVGDGLGYDVRSYEKDGRDRFIEVKTTAYGKYTPFYISQSEVSASDRLASDYHLYRLFQFREAPRLYILDGDIARNCHLNPVLFAAHVL